MISLSPAQHHRSQGALLEPLNVGVNAADRARLAFGQSVLIQGAGPIGLTLLLTAQSYGASPVLISDISPRCVHAILFVCLPLTLSSVLPTTPRSRLEFARRLGGIPVRADDEAFVETVRSLVDAHGVGDQRDHRFVPLVCFAHALECSTLSSLVLRRPRLSGVDVCFDASGAAAAIANGVKATRSGGKFLSIGRGSSSEVCCSIIAMRIIILSIILLLFLLFGLLLFSFFFFSFLLFSSLLLRFCCRFDAALFRH